MVLRGRLPGATRLATGAPAASTGAALKSVSWLFSMIPRAMWNEPSVDSTVVVIVTTLPSLSTIEMCVVPCSGVLSMPSGGAPKSPAAAVPMLRVQADQAALGRRSC